jgi:hypothetical protein
LKRKLIVLDLVLLAVLCVLGMRLRDTWLEAEKREVVVLHKTVKTVPPPLLSPLPQVQPATAAAYVQVAQKMLFSKDRNPVVVIEVAPPKPMPALPVVHGVIDIGDGATAIMSAKKGDAHRGFHAGEKVGDFKLVAVNTQEIALEWEGKTIRKRVEDLIDRSAPEPGPAAGVARPATPSAPAPAQVSAPVRSAPGVDTGAGLRACVPGDNSPAGSIVDGYKKMVIKTPFGEICRWEAAK